MNIASGVGLLPTGGGSTAYVASKGGVIAMTRALAAELAPAIRVNAVCPGAVETPMTDGTLRDAAGAVIPAIVNRYALGRPAAPEEIAAAHPVPDIARKLVRDRHQPGGRWRADLPLTDGASGRQQITVPPYSGHER